MNWELVGSYGGLLGLATFAIYVGAHGSLPRAKDLKAKKCDDEEVEEDDEERLTSEDAWIFPIVGSVTLFGLYLIVKYGGQQWINWLLKWYFSLAGVGSVWRSSVTLMRYIVGEDRWKKYEMIELSVKKGTGSQGEIFRMKLRTPSVVLLPLSVIPPGLYVYGGQGSAILTDVLGLTFSYNALSLLRLDSFQTGAILLSGLFVYDVWWVFGTEVMVKVATTLDVPIKLLWAKREGYTMLGLGDVVIPGTVIALGLRYDHARGLGGRPYFWAGMGSYVVGLMTTMVMMHVYGRAQPALLYLSPGCILSFVGTGLLRGEIAAVWRYIDRPNADRVKEI